MLICRFCRSIHKALRDVGALLRQVGSVCCVLDPESVALMCRDVRGIESGEESFADLLTRILTFACEAVMSSPDENAKFPLLQRYFLSNFAKYRWAREV